jgi:hypothetical protein
MAELLHQHAGVDPNWTRESAASVARAGLDGVVFVSPQERCRDDRASGLTQHFSAQNNALPRGRREMSAMAYRKAFFRKSMMSPMTSFVDHGRPALAFPRNAISPWPAPSNTYRVLWAPALFKALCRRSVWLGEMSPSWLPWKRRKGAAEALI